MRPTAQEPPAKAVSIELSISVEEYDPYVPSKGVLKCVLHNNSTQPVRAPLGYDGSTAVLHGGLVTLAPRKAPTKDELKTAAVDPGKDEILFTLPLDDILLQGDKPSGDWYWNWMRRPEPPRSPVHKYRKVGFVDEAEFQAVVVIGPEKIASNKVMLKVKPSKSKE